MRPPGPRLYDEGLLKDTPLNPISTRLPAVPGGGGGVPIDDTMNTSNNSIPPFIPLRNDFDILDDDDNGDGQNGVEQAKKAPKVRLPPIHVMDLSVGDVFKLLNDNGLPRSEAFLLKHTRTSVLPKKLEFFDFLSRHHIDIATVSETWLKPKQSFFHPDYRCVRADRENQDDERGGGVLIAIRKDIHFKILDINTSAIETVGIEILNAAQPVHIIAVYFPGVHHLTSPLVTNLESPEAIDRCIAMFTSFIIEAESTAVPTAPVRSYKEAEFAESTRRLVQLRNTRRRQWFRTRDPLLADIVEALNVRIRNECTIARNQHFSSSIRHLENGAKDLWRISKALRNSVKYTPPLKNGDSLVAAPSEKANLLADSFANAHRNTLPSEPSVIAQVEESVAHITATDSTTAAAPVDL
ncbi:hypothetical protein pipiens_011020 [Culex pipiens pipiens]|uniref:Uncharacterized protein n=1 Tax=Culex pipiens pipiens TaxID=38569 RepID=A0ABD1D8I3_CULPP